MDHTYNKETLSFYLVAIASALAAIAAMCASAFWRATGGVAVGFALFLPALVLACLGFSYPSPLNKVRCAAMLGNTLALSALYVCLFIAGDLAGAKVVLYTVAGVFQPNAMGVLMTVFMGFGLLVAIMTGVRVLMQTFGKSMNDLERKLHVQSTSDEAVGGATEVSPRNVDERQILAKADQEVRMNRISIQPAEEDNPRATVTPQEVRARSLAREQQRASVEPAQPVPTQTAPVQTAPVQPTPVQSAPIEPAPIERAPVYSAPIEPAPNHMEPVASEEAPVESAPEPSVVEKEEGTPPLVRSILDAEESAPTSPEADTDDVIYAQTDDVDENVDDDTPEVEVEMAHVVDLPIYDMRTEQAMYRPRQKDASATRDELYTDFSYSDKTPPEDTDD